MLGRSWNLFSLSKYYCTYLLYVRCVPSWPGNNRSNYTCWSARNFCTNIMGFRLICSTWSAVGCTIFKWFRISFLLERFLNVLNLDSPAVSIFDLVMFAYRRPPGLKMIEQLAWNRFCTRTLVNGQKIEVDFSEWRRDFYPMWKIFVDKICWLETRIFLKWMSLTTTAYYIRIIMGDIFFFNWKRFSRSSIFLTISRSNKLPTARLEE